MSGGHFDGYVYYQVQRFVDDLEFEIDRNFDAEDEDYEWCAKFGEKTIDYLKEQIKHLKKTAEIMRAIDYLYSGDYGEDCFAERISQIEEEYSEEL